MKKIKTKKFSDLPRIIQLTSSGDRIQTQADWLQSQDSSPLCNNQTQYKAKGISHFIKQGVCRDKKRKNTERNQPINLQHAPFIMDQAEPLLYLPSSPFPRLTHTAISYSLSFIID